MKTLLTALALTLFSLASVNTSFGQDKTYKLTVFIPDIANRTGKLYVGLANSEATFAGASWKTLSADVSAKGETTIEFVDVPAGTYAVRVYQDINGNGKLDREGMMPSEPFGFSKIVMLMAPPMYEDASFTLAEDTRMKVTMMNQL